MARAELSSLVEGALLAALTAMLALIGFVIPPLSVVSKMIWTVPIVVLIVRRDLKTGVLATIVSAFVVSAFVGLLQAFLLILQFGGLGLTYGYLFKNRAATSKALFGGTVVAVASTTLVIGLFTGFSALTVKNLEIQAAQAVTAAMEMYRQMGLLDYMAQQGMTPEMLRESLNKAAQTIVILMPGFLVASAAMTAAVNFIVARLVLIRLGLPAPVLPPFREWQLSWLMTWGVIAGLAFWLSGDYFKWPVISVVGKNILYVYFPLLLTIGLSVITYFYHKMKPSMVLKLIAVVFVLFNPPAAILTLVGLGLFDPLLNYRRLSTANREGE